MMVPKDVYILTPRTYQCYYYLMGQRDFKEVSKLGTLRWGNNLGGAWRYRRQSKKDM